MEPTYHLAKMLEVGRFGGMMTYWCGRGMALSPTGTYPAAVVFQEEFATCTKCRTAFAHALGDFPKDLKGSSVPNGGSFSRPLPTAGLRDETELAG